METDAQVCPGLLLGPCTWLSRAAGWHNPNLHHLPEEGLLDGSEPCWVSQGSSPPQKQPCS